jgi:hypothetical protein
MMAFGAHLTSFIDRTLFLAACLKQKLALSIITSIQECFNRSHRYQIVVQHEDEVDEPETTKDDFWRLRSIMTHSAFKIGWQLVFILLLLLVGMFAFSLAEGNSGLG